MKSIKAIACVLSVAMLAGIFAGCSKTTKITTDKFIKACEKLKLEYFDFEDDSPETDDLEDGFYSYADEDMVEDNSDSVEDLLMQIGLSEVIDAEDVVSLAFAAKASGYDDIEDVRDPSDVEDLEVEGALAFQMTLAEDSYAEDIMDYLDDMLDLANISSKDLTNQEFYVSKKEGYLRFHVDIAKAAALVSENDDIMELADLIYDADDVEDVLGALKGDVAITIEINGSSIFVLVGGAVNTKTTTLDSFAKAFGAANNPTKIAMNESVVEDAIEEAYDMFYSEYGSYLSLADVDYDNYDDYDDYDDDDYEDEED